MNASIGNSKEWLQPLAGRSTSIERAARADCSRDQRRAAAAFLVTNLSTRFLVRLNRITQIEDLSISTLIMSALAIFIRRMSTQDEVLILVRAPGVSLDEAHSRIPIRGERVRSIGNCWTKLKDLSRRGSRKAQSMAQSSISLFASMMQRVDRRPLWSYSDALLERSRVERVARCVMALVEGIARDTICR